LGLQNYFLGLQNTIFCTLIYISKRQNSIPLFAYIPTDLAIEIAKDRLNNDLTLNSRTGFNVEVPYISCIKKNVEIHWNYQES
jgi:hypothetical protein